MNIRRGNVKTLILLVILVAAVGGGAYVWMNGIDSLQGGTPHATDGPDGKPLIVEKPPREGTIVLSDMVSLYMDPVRGGAVYVNDRLGFPPDRMSGFTDHERTDRYVVFVYPKPEDGGAPSREKRYGFVDVNTMHLEWDLTKNQAAAALRRAYSATLPERMK